jgi:single-stranded DNA-binding protein
VTSVNLVMLMGTVEGAPQPRDDATAFRLKTHEQWSAKGGRSGERTVIHIVTAEGKLALPASRLQGGDLVHVEGRLRYDGHQPAQVIALRLEAL